MSITVRKLMFIIEKYMELLFLYHLSRNNVLTGRFIRSDWEFMLPLFCEKYQHSKGSQSRINLLKRGLTAYLFVSLEDYFICIHDYDSM